MVIGIRFNVLKCCKSKVSNKEVDLFVHVISIFNDLGSISPYKDLLNTSLLIHQKIRKNYVRENADH